MKPRTKRFALIAIGIVVLAGAAAFVLNAFQSNLCSSSRPHKSSKAKRPRGERFVRVAWSKKAACSVTATAYVLW